MIARKTANGAKLLALASLGEAVTGLTLLVDPPIVTRLLFGTEIAGAAVAMSRVAGLALIALGLACWPPRGDVSAFAFGGMVTYGATVALYLAYLGAGGALVGPMLWPAVALHALLTTLLARAWYLDRAARDARS